MIYIMVQKDYKSKIESQHDDAIFVTTCFMNGYEINTYIFFHFYVDEV